MFNRILVPTDGSPLAEKAVDAALDLAAKSGAQVFVISVAEPTLESADGFASVAKDVQLHNQEVQRLARHYADNAAVKAERKSVSCKTIVAVSQNPYVEIVQATKQYKCDAIFMATHGRRGLSKLFAGSQTQQVLNHADVPVVVFK